MPNYESTSQRFLKEKKKKQTTIDHMYSRNVKGPILLTSTITYATENTGRCRQIYETGFDLGPDKAREHLDVTKKMIVIQKSF